MLILASSHIAHIFTDLTKKEVGGERFPLSSGGRCLTQAEIPKRQKIDNLITNCEVKHFSVFCCLSSGQRRYSYLLRVGLCERHTGEICVGHYVDIPRHARSLDRQRGHSMLRSDMFLFAARGHSRLSFSSLYSLSTPGFAQGTALPASPRLHASVP